jgi:hypothetical protein
VPSLTTPIADDRNETNAAAREAATVRPVPDGVRVPRERWLRSETVDELRMRRARIGLPVPRGKVSVSRPPLTSLGALVSAVRSPRHTGALPAGPRASVILGPICGTVIGLLAGIACALVAYVAHLPIPGM